MTFCYWQIRSDIDFWVGSVLACCSLVITCYSIFNLLKYCRYRKQVKVQNSVSIILILMPLWGIAHFSKLIFGLWIFIFKWKNKEHYSQDLQYYSKIFCVFDSISTMFLHGLLLILPYIWICNIVTLLSDQSNNNSNQKIPKYIFLTKLIRFYMIFRYIIYINLFVIEIVNEESQMFCRMYIIYNIRINIIIICESAICVILVLECLTMLLANFENLKHDQGNQKVKVKAIQKVGIEIIYYNCNFMCCKICDKYVIYNNITRNRLYVDKCQYDVNFINNFSHTFVYLGLGIIITHFIPIILIFRLYSLNVGQCCNIYRNQSEPFYNINNEESNISY